MAETKDKDKNKKDDIVRETPDGDMVVRTVGRDFRVEGNDVDGYVGVTAEYRNYANETEKPYTTDEDVEIFLASGTLTDVEVMTAQNAEANARAKAAQGDDDEEDEESDDKSEKAKDDKAGAEATGSSTASGSTTPSAPSTGGRQAAGANTPNR